MPWDSFDPGGGPPPVTPPPNSAPPPANTGGYPPWYNPYDFSSDPFLMEALAEAERMRALYAIQENEARRQSIIGLGGGTDEDYAGWGLSAEDIAAGKANFASGRSVLARLAQQHEDRQRGLIGSLADRGVIYSGATGFHTLREGRQYGNEQYDARAKVLEYLRGVTEQRLDREASLRGMVTQARMGAYDRALQRPPPYTGNEPGSIPEMPALTQKAITASPLAQMAKALPKYGLKRKPKKKFGLAGY